MVGAAGLSLLALLAGCAGNGNAPKGVSLGSGTTVTLAEAPSGISGVLVDDAIRPVAAAKVLLGGGLALNQSANTTADGLFTFAGLEPGLYTLRVDAFADKGSARRFLRTQTTAEVKAGETAKVRMVLLADKSPLPYHTTYKFEGFYQASSGFVDEILDLYVYNQTYGPVTTPQNPGCTCRFPFVIDGPMQTLMLELQYDETSASGDGWTMSVDNHGGDPTTLYFCNEGEQTSGPCIYRVEAAADTKTFPPAQTGNYTIGVWTDPGWVYVNQKFTLYMTAFYVAPAPDGWSFVKGDM